VDFNFNVTKIDCVLQYERMSHHVLAMVRNETRLRALIPKELPEKCIG
jgi:hypothetical protein